MSTFVEWTENEYVNVEKIDTQHQELVDLVNEIHSQIGKLTTDLNKIYISRIVNHLRLHFDTEEECMHQTKFPGFISHKLEHDRLFLKMSNIKKEIDSNNSKITIELLQSLKNWLFNHLEINDKKCAAYFIEFFAKNN